MSHVFSRARFVVMVTLVGLIGCGATPSGGGGGSGGAAGGGGSSAQDGSVAADANLAQDASAAADAMIGPDGPRPDAPMLRIPLFSSVSPGFGRVGDAITIIGLYIGDATAVSFNGVPATFTVTDDSHLSVTVPDAHTGPVTITTPHGVAESDNNFDYIRPPTITSFTPTSGPEGTRVYIYGLDLSNGRNVFAVRFNGVIVTSALRYTYPPERLSLVVPDTATTGPIQINWNDGTVTTMDDFTVTPEP